ncbi:hypothetical protein [Metamycoplasma hyosynoviae]|uniref:hypothetical protein n=1 Tax=Metamycoplasma hyosynoviae TaxID=29559 RepID=UPI0023608BD7|nr:hypothetical protein [Metamycoplasma hyosynoviae]MDD1359425.1 hypothetical protein [Metamycoplasma hyosynoviae]MDD1360500.1 hypothetical protein [Metamycoplasma hyosynoviae]MDD1362029.1 hypothetical protein [Metamycoplasma hyosynoviae]
MKKLLLLMPALLAPIPLAVSCVREETQEEKDEKLAKKYEKEYVDRQKYVFDDFEQFKIKDEHFREINEKITFWNNPHQKIYVFTWKFVEDFREWYANFQHKFNIFKKVMNKYASKEIIEYKNPNISTDPIHLYYVKEVKFDFSRGMSPQSYCVDAPGGEAFNEIVKLFNIPNLNLNLSSYWSFGELDILNNTSIAKTYYSKINITGVFNAYFTAIEKMRDIFSIPKPYYKSEHFMTYPAGEEQYQGKGDWKPKITFESFRGLEKLFSTNKLLRLRYKISPFSSDWKKLDENYIEQYGNYNPLKFASYRFEIIEYDPDKAFDAEPSKIDEFVLSKHGI